MGIEYLYDHHADVLAQCDYDANVACVQIMGASLRDTLTPEARHEIVALLDQETNEAGSLSLVGELVFTSRSAVSGERGLAWLRALARGLRGARV